jgi:hypothetical protein
MATEGRDPPGTERLIAAAILSSCAIVAFRGAIAMFFAQDDFRGFAVAAGLQPRHEALWRYVSVQLFMDVLFPLFGQRPWPYHLVVLGLHCANATLLYALLARMFRGPAALIAACFFAVHPAHFTALYWLSARADVMATTFALCAIALALRHGRERWLAVPTLALALLSKESVLGVSVIVVLLQWWTKAQSAGVPGSKAASTGPQRRLRVDSLAIVLLALSACFAMLLPSKGGIRAGSDPSMAYAVDVGTPLLQNLLTYVGWTVDLAMVSPGMRFVDAPNPGLYPLATAVFLASLLGGLMPALRARGWLIGVCSYLLLLLPVLPLRNHTYRYYLYGPLIAASLCVGSAAEALVSARTAPRGKRSQAARGAAGGNRRAVILMWCLAGLASLLLTWNSARLVSEMERRPSPVYPGLRGDPIVDRSLIAERAISTLKAAPLAPRTELVFVFRERLALLGRISAGSGEEPPPTQEVYPELNVRSALLDGVGVVALIPSVAKASFVRTVPDDPGKGSVAVYAPTGEVEVFGRSQLDSLLRSPWINRW